MKWTNVKDKLPPIGRHGCSEYFLVCNGGLEMITARLWKSGEWQTCYELIVTQTVTHWGIKPEGPNGHSMASPDAKQKRKRPPRSI